MNFKEFKRVYIETCNKIIEEKGKCVSIACNDCPFSYSNQTNGINCVENRYNDGTKEDCEQEVLLNSAKEYLKLIKGKEMTKNDLKDGMVVENRKGNRMFVLSDCFIFEKNTYDPISYYNNNLKNIYHEELDIIKVYKTSANDLKRLFKDEHLSLIWEREEKSESEIKLEKIQKQIEKLNKSVEEFKNEVTKLVCQNIERRINDCIRRDD